MERVGEEGMLDTRLAGGLRSTRLEKLWVKGNSSARLPRVLSTGGEKTRRDGGLIMDSLSASLA